MLVRDEILPLLQLLQRVSKVAGPIVFETGLVFALLFRCAGLLQDHTWGSDGSIASIPCRTRCLSNCL
jgi:hypothetical protein